MCVRCTWRPFNKSKCVFSIQNEHSAAGHVPRPVFSLCRVPSVLFNSSCMPLTNSLHEPKHQEQRGIKGEKDNNISMKTYLVFQWISSVVICLFCFALLNGPVKIPHRNKNEWNNTRASSKCDRNEIVLNASKTPADYYHSYYCWMLFVCVAAVPAQDTNKPVVVFSFASWFTFSTKGSATFFFFSLNDGRFCLAHSVSLCFCSRLNASYSCVFNLLFIFC